jgi:hypothetical protein
MTMRPDHHPQKPTALEAGRGGGYLEVIGDRSPRAADVSTATSMEHAMKTLCTITLLIASIIATPALADRPFGSSNFGYQASQDR